jgi:ankyrin repeat protein/DNA-binding transcriptional MerR regulator
MKDDISREGDNILVKDEKTVYRTGQFAEMAGVTKRTLRYYDRFGLLKPSEISESGQRLYAEDDFIRLQQIVTLKFVGFSLEQIKNIMEMHEINLSALLIMQREWMEEKIRNMQLAVQAIKEAERVVEQGKEGTSAKFQRIIGVIEMEAKRDWVNEFLSAAVNGYEEKTKTILAANKDIPASSIYAAVVLGEVEIVQKMLIRDTTLALKQGGPENWEPLLYLCFSCFLKNPQYSERFVQTAKLLLDHGANENAIYIQKGDPYERKLSALYGVVGVAGNAKVAKVLLEAGANPNDGESLYHAAELPSHECLELLYQYGVDINATPAIFRKLDFDDYIGVKWFLEHGADPDQKLGNNDTPLHWAVYRGRSTSIIELLIKHGAQVDAKRPDGKTAFMLAVRYGQTDLAYLLHKHGAATDVDSINSLFGAYATVNEPEVQNIIKKEPSLLSSLSDQDRMMLIEFAELNKAEAVNLMLETGFDSSIKKEAGTALHFAAWHAHIETVRVLITHGASLTSTNLYGGTPLDSAIHGSIHCLSTQKGAHTAVVEALIQAGAVLPEKAWGSKAVYEVLCRYGALEY